MHAFLVSIVAFEEANWKGQVALAITQLPGIIVALTNYPKVDGVLKNLLTALQLMSNLQHKDSPGTLKFPLTLAKPPTVIGQTVTVTTTAPATIGKIGVLLVALACSGLSACASVSWSEPVLYAGPTVSPYEEVSKGSQPAVAAGIQATVGLGQFEFSEHQWDLLDPGLLALGGMVPGGGPAGMLQIGGKVGTLNGLIGVGLLFDCVDSTGNGACQGGHPGGPIYAGLFDVQALVAYIAPAVASDEVKAKPRLPRGGL
jgi:hypothetical protein